MANCEISYLRGSSCDLLLCLLEGMASEGAGGTERSSGRSETISYLGNCLNVPRWALFSLCSDWRAQWPLDCDFSRVSAFVSRQIRSQIDSLRCARKLR